MSKILCTNPFSYCDIDLDGNVYVCCNKWCNFYSIGNILEDDLDEIFSGKKIQEFIKQFINQEFKYCRIDTCLGSKTIEDSKFEQLYNEISANKKRKIRLNFDNSCNLQCIFCRHKFQMANGEENKAAEKLIARIKEFLPELDKNHCEISLNGVGEVFVSKPFLDLIKHISLNYSNIKFQIITNGILCSKDMLENLGIVDKILGLEVSVHAFKEETYNKLVKGGNFKKLKENLQYISTLKEQNKIQRFQINFAINAYNYKEMVAFANWAIKLGAEPFFLPLLLLKDNESEKALFNKLNVTDKNHPEYNQFIKVMKKLSSIRNQISIPEHYYKLQENKSKSFIAKLFKR